MSATPISGRRVVTAPACGRSILLPRADGSLVAWSPSGASPGPFPRVARPVSSRVVYAAAHVVADPLARTGADGSPRIDWEATLAFRRHLFGLGLGVAEAMDTAQRGMGLGWRAASELIRRTCSEARGLGARVCAGAGTDQLAPGEATSLHAVVAAYLEQCAVVQSSGATVVVMASRELCRLARGPEDYAAVYSAVLSELDGPAILHWLGEAFDPALAGYWGSRDAGKAAASLLSIVREQPVRVDGVKSSLLDQGREVALRAGLPEGVRLYTGDDYDYPEAIAGDGTRHSDALLGAFDFAAPAAAWALDALDGGDREEFLRRIRPTVPLSRKVFEPPTPFYKTGVVFLAYLNGFQGHFKMIGGLESARSTVHLAEVLRLADAAGLLLDPELAVARMRHILALAGAE